MSTTALVLAVTPDPGIKAGVQEALGGCTGVKVLFARDGDHARKLLQYVRFALLIVEIVPPELRELEVLEQLNAGSARGRTPVIAIASSTNTGLQARCAGVDECLVKPLGENALRDLVPKQLGCLCSR